MSLRPRVAQQAAVELHLMQVTDHLQPRTVAQVRQHRLGGIEILKLQRVGNAVISSAPQVLTAVWIAVRSQGMTIGIFDCFNTCEVMALA